MEPPDRWWYVDDGADATSGYWTPSETQAEWGRRRGSRVVEYVRKGEMMTFTCPRCGMTSAHPKDVEHGYCGNCHDWTGSEGAGYVCPNGHGIPPQVAYLCTERGCDGAVVYEPSAKGMALARRVEALERELGYAIDALEGKPWTGWTTDTARDVLQEVASG